MNFFIRLIKRLFGKEKIKYIAAPEVSQTRNIVKNNDFRANLIYQADPEICAENGYKIKKVRLEDMV